MENEKYESSNAAPTNFENDLLGHNSIRPSEIPSEHKELSILNDANIQGVVFLSMKFINFWFHSNNSEKSQRKKK